MKLNLGEVEVEDAGLSKNKNQKWTGKKIVAVDGKEYCVLLTVVEQQEKFNRKSNGIPSIETLNKLIADRAGAPLSVEAYNKILKDMGIK